MSAIISDCGRYRYRLERGGDGVGATGVIMVNPSTADANIDDATIRRLKNFGARNDWGRIIVGNLFAYRATDVRKLGHVADPIGPLNDEHLQRIAGSVDRIVVAWGQVKKQPARFSGRWRQFAQIVGDAPLFSIGEPTKCGHPRHPLRLAHDRKILPWSMA